MGIEFVHQDKKVTLIQPNYALDMLQEIGLLGCKPETSPIEAHMQLWVILITLRILITYQRLLGKLIYLNDTWPDIMYMVSVLSHFM